MTTQNRTREQTPRPGWPVPAALMALSAIPLIAGTLRLLQLAGGPELIPAEERFAEFPLAVALHILGAATYVLLGALQFVPQFRRRHRTWHRRAGRILIVAGLLVAASALWMTLLYAAKPGTGDLLYVLRLVFGCALVACLVLGFAAIRRRKIPAHRAWMIRAYAIALAAGTQAFTQGVGGALLRHRRAPGRPRPRRRLGHQPRRRRMGHPPPHPDPPASPPGRSTDPTERHHRGGTRMTADSTPTASSPTSPACTTSTRPSVSTRPVRASAWPIRWLRRTPRCSIRGSIRPDAGATSKTSSARRIT